MSSSSREAFREFLGGMGPTELLILKLMGLGFAAAGLAAMGGGLWAYLGTRAFLDRASAARGEVTALVRRESQDGVTYAPAIRFRTARGQPIEFVATVSSRPPEYAVGDEVDVLYDPARPAGATIRSFSSLWGAVVVLEVLGLPFAAAGVILLALFFKARAASARHAPPD
jgi:hypothetical protein